MDYLQVRFATELTPDVVETINQQPSPALLRSWYKTARRSKTYDDFLAVLRQ